MPAEEPFKFELTPQGCIVITVPFMREGELKKPLRHTVSLENARALYLQLKEILPRIGDVETKQKQVKPGELLL